MAIKLYKSQLEPTTVSSNVESKAFVSMEEAASIGKSFKGMVKSGEKLYYKYLDRKTDNEVFSRVEKAINLGLFRWRRTKVSRLEWFGSYPQKSERFLYFPRTIIICGY